MKIGIVLTGVAWGQAVGTAKADRDWKLAKDNIKEKLINVIPNAGVYLTTYPHPELTGMIEHYNASKAVIIPYQGSQIRTTYKRSMEELIYEDLDFIIATRYDIHFNTPVNTWNIDYNKFNFLFKEIEPFWTNDRFVGDALYAFPKKYLFQFIEAINRENLCPYRDNYDMHPMYRHVSHRIGDWNTHFIFDGCHNSGDNQFFKLIRA